MIIESMLFECSRAFFFVVINTFVFFDLTGTHKQIKYLTAKHSTVHTVQMIVGVYWSSTVMQFQFNLYKAVPKKATHMTHVKCESMGVRQTSKRSMASVTQIQTATGNSS